VLAQCSALAYLQLSDNPINVRTSLVSSFDSGDIFNEVFFLDGDIVKRSKRKLLRMGIPTKLLNMNSHENARGPRLHSLSLALSLKHAHKTLSLSHTPTPTHPHECYPLFILLIRGA